MLQDGMVGKIEMDEMLFVPYRNIKNISKLDMLKNEKCFGYEFSHHQ